MRYLSLTKRHLGRVFRDIVRNRLASSVLVPSPVRWMVLRVLGLNVRKSYIAPGLFVGGAGLRVGRGVILNYECFIDATGLVDLAHNVAIGPRSMILTVTHDVGPSHKRRGADQLVQDVTIGAGSWLGGGVTVLPGSVIGPGCVIAAGSVVRGNLQGNCVYGGVPARFIREIS